MLSLNAEIAVPQPGQRACSVCEIGLETGTLDARMLMTTSQIGVVRVRGVSSTAEPFFLGRDHHSPRVDMCH